MEGSNSPGNEDVPSGESQANAEVIEENDPSMGDSESEDLADGTT